MDSPKMATTPTASRNRARHSRGGNGSTSLGAPRSLLRAAVVSLQVQEPRRYFVQLTLLPASPEPAASDTTRGNPAPPGTAARTETSKAVASPEFLNNTFCLRMPGALGRQHTSESNPAPAAVLQAQVMAAPTIDMAPRPLSAGGRERHEVLASGVLPIQGEVAARLLSGQKALQDMVLAPVAPEDDAPTMGRGYTKLGSASSSYIRLQVELQMLDGDLLGGTAPQVPGPPSSRNSVVSGSRSSVYTAPFSPSTHPFLRNAPSRTPTSSLAPSRTCSLAVLVSRAENIPMVTNTEGVKAPPSLFVAAKTVRQAAQRASSSAVTSAVEDSCAPVWDETLSLTFHESGMPKERVLLALVNKQTSKLLFKCSIPVGGLRPGQHYNMALDLGRPRDRERPGSGPPPRLFLTLFLGNFPSEELGLWEGLAGEELTRLSAAVDPGSLPAPEGPQHGVAAVWKLVGDSTLAMEPPGPFSGGLSRPIHHELQADDENALGEWIAQKRSPSGRGPGERAEDSMPLLSCSVEGAAAAASLWSPHGVGSEAVLVAGQATRQSVDPALVLELHGLWKRPRAAQGAGSEGDLGAGDETQQGNAAVEEEEEEKGEQVGPAAAPSESGGAREEQGVGEQDQKAEEEGPAVEESGGDEADPGSGSPETEDLVALEEGGEERPAAGHDDEGPQEGEEKDPEAAEADGKEGGAQDREEYAATHLHPFLDAAEAPVAAEGPPLPTPEVAAAHESALREARFGPPPGSKGAELLESHNTLLGRVVIRLEDLPEGRSGDIVMLPNLPILHFKGSESNPTCTIRLRLWGTESYLAHLREGEARDSSHQDPQAPGTPVGANWMGFLAGGEDLQGSQNSPVSHAELGAGSKTAQTLIGDLLDKQNVLEAFQRQVERAEAMAEQTTWRMSDLQKKHTRLQGDLVQLQQLLDEERRAAAQSLAGGGGDPERMDHDELVATNRALRQAAEKEQRRAVELERQLRRQHSDAVEHRDLSYRFAELQEAHVAQGQQLRDLEKEASRVPQYKVAIKSQEAVIARMEGMLTEALKDRQELKALREQVPRLRSENAELREARNYVNLDGDEPAETEDIRQEAALARAAELQAKSELQELQEERLEAMMKAEQAEAQRAALQRELTESTKRYAREVAMLKAHLAEKEAQVMGGVGRAADIALSSTTGAPSDAPRSSKPPSMRASRSPEVPGLGLATSEAPRSPATGLHPSIDVANHEHYATDSRMGSSSSGGGSLSRPRRQPNADHLGNEPYGHEVDGAAAATRLQGEHGSSAGTRSLMDGSDGGRSQSNSASGSSRASRPNLRRKQSPSESRAGSTASNGAGSNASLPSQAPSNRPRYMQPTASANSENGSASGRRERRRPSRSRSTVQAESETSGRSLLSQEQLETEPQSPGPPPLPLDSNETDSGAAPPSSWPPQSPSVQESVESHA